MSFWMASYNARPPLPPPQSPPPQCAAPKGPDPQNRTLRRTCRSHLASEQMDVVDKEFVELSDLAKCFLFLLPFLASSFAFFLFLQCYLFSLFLLFCTSSFGQVVPCLSMHLKILYTFSANLDSSALGCFWRWDFNALHKLNLH